jgi:hypothetical protein
MQIAEAKKQYLSTTALMVLGLFVCVLSNADVAAIPTYADSAHGNSTDGVNRSGTPDTEAYDTGACTHCHDTYDGSTCGVNVLMLFAPNNPTSQTDNFCFQCHKGTGSVQVGGITNNDYGATFGGATPMFTSIYDAFNPSGTYASSHDLLDLQAYARGRAWGSWMTTDTNACLVCHDSHLSQKNFPVQASPEGGVKTAVRRGNDVNDYPGDLWGDEPYSVSGRNEMMSDWASAYVYQAPYRVGGTTYEPAGDATADGSNLPNFVDACAQTCHRKDIDATNGPIAVNWKLSSSDTWPGTPSKHGRAAADNAAGDWGWLKPPYSESSRGDYVLSCTDCHETHGSTNATLLRTTVNSVAGLTTGDKGCNYPDGGYWYYWCQTCHDLTYNPETQEGHPVIWPEARCGDSMGCHLFKTSGYDQCPGGNHGYYF